MGSVFQGKWPGILRIHFFGANFGGLGSNFWTIRPCAPQKRAIKKKKADRRPVFLNRHQGSVAGGFFPASADFFLGGLWHAHRPLLRPAGRVAGCLAGQVAVGLACWFAGSLDS